MVNTKLLLLRKKLILLKLLHSCDENLDKKKRFFWVRKVYAERLEKGEFH